MSQLVFGDIRSAKALKAGATKRQVSVVIGDSTTDHDAGNAGGTTHGGAGGGWMWGVAKALSDLHGIWGSFIHPRRGSSATPVGPWVHSGFQVAGAATGAPADVEADITVVEDVDVGSNGNRVMTVYEYLGAGTSSSSNAQTRITVSTLHPRRASGATMKGVLEWYSADSGSGTFRLELRNISPFSQLALSSAISTNTGAVERHVASVTGTDSNTSSDVSLWLNSATGPVTFGRAGIVWPNQTVGHTVFPLAKFGGRPSVTMLRHLQQAGPRRIAAALRLALDEAGPDADLFVWVSQGFNNPNYHTASAGPASSTGTLVSATSTTVTLPASEGTADHLGKVITITGGTGGPGSSQQEANAQTRLITAYNTSTRVATLESAWSSTPDSTSTYRIGWSDSSAYGYEDDMRGVMALFEEAMQILGRSAENVHFILIPPTLTKTNNPGSVPELSYSGSRERALYLAKNRDRVLAPDWLSLVPLRTMVDRGDHYSWPSDSIHLKSTASAGFAPMAETLVEAIIDYADSGADVGALSDTALAQIIEAITGSEEIDQQQQANAQAALTAQGLTTERAAAIDTIESQTTAVQQQANVQAGMVRVVHGGRAIYVAADGDDGNDGLTPSTALATLAAAQSVANAGDTIVVGPGSYSGQSLGADGVAWEFAPGAVVTRSTNGVLWTDDGSGMELRIRGRGRFVTTNGVVFRASNSDSRFDIECESIEASGSDQAAVYASNGSWIRVHARRHITSNGYDALLAESGGTIIGEADQLIAVDNTTEASGGFVFATCRECRSGSAAAVSESANSFVHLRCDRIIPTVGVEAVYTDNASTTVIVECLDIRGRITHKAGSTRILGGTVTTTGLSWPVEVEGDGLVLQNVRLVAASATNAIVGTGTVRVVGELDYNKPPASGVTLAYTATSTAALESVGLDSTSVSELGEAVAAVSERVMTALPAAEPGTEGAGLALSGEAGGEGDAIQAKQDQLIALFQQGLPDVAPGQQRGARRIVRGDTYSSDGRSLLITRHKNAEWPEDLSLWNFTLETSIHPDNTNTGALAGTVEVVTATGASRGVRMVFTAAQTQAAALGRHLYAVRATLADDADVVWTVEMGSIEVESATE